MILKNNFSERPGCDQAEIGKCQISELPGSTILPYDLCHKVKDLDEKSLISPLIPLNHELKPN